MALAARTQADPRTQCPVCGGSIHPIAGKCKHCKTDLVKLRKQQAAAAAVGAASAPRSPYAPRPQTAPIAPTVASAPVPLPIAQPGSAPVNGAPVVIAAPIAPAPDPYYAQLPPLRRSTWSRTWPIVVAVIAAAAIVVSVILLLTGNDKKAHGEKAEPPPAPDRMNTDPIPPPATGLGGSADPWQGAPGGSGNTFPAAPDPVPAPAAPAAPAPPSAPVSVPPPEKWQGTMYKTICHRLIGCGMVDPDAQQICDSAGGFDDQDTAQRVSRGECTYDRAKASSCLAALDAFPCPGGKADLTALSSAIAQTLDCGAALDCH